MNPEHMSRREFGEGLIKLLFSGAVLSTLGPFIPGCGGQKPTSSSLEEIATEQLLKKGELFHKYNNFKKFELLESLPENRYKVKVSYDNQKIEYVLEITKTKIYPSHPDEVFADYIIKHYNGFFPKKINKRILGEDVVDSCANQTKENIINGNLKAVGYVIVKSEFLKNSRRKTSDEKITAFLEKNQANKYQWRFISKVIDINHMVLNAFESAYTKEKDREFQQFK